MKSKLLTFLLALLISFGLWLYVATVISPESEVTLYDIPVELVGSDYLSAHDLIIVSDTKNLTMDLKLRGNRSDINKLNSSNITILADLSKIKSAGKYQIDCSVSFQSGTAEIISQEPKAISIEVAAQKTKNVDVRVIYTGSVPDGYELDKTVTELNHTSVEVKGTQAVLDKIEYAAIEVNVNDKMTSFLGDYPVMLYGSNALPLMDTTLVTTDITKVTARMQVNKVKKVELNIVADYTDSGLRSDMVELLYDKTVTIIGSDEALSSVDPSYTLTVSLADFTQTTIQTLKLTLPEGAKCKEEIKVEIIVPTMRSKEGRLDASHIAVENAPEGWQIIPMGTAHVEVYGPESVVRDLDIETLWLSMDCANVSNLQPDMNGAVYTIRALDSQRNITYLRVRVTWGVDGSVSIVKSEGGSNGTDGTRP